MASSPSLVLARKIWGIYATKYKLSYLHCSLKSEEIWKEIRQSGVYFKIMVCETLQDIKSLPAINSTDTN